MFSQPTNASSPGSDAAFAIAACQCWQTYYQALRRVHIQEGRSITDPVRDRNLSTTDSKHVSVLECFCRQSLADALGVPLREVNKRTVKFSEHRSKSFDVCWPMTGDPKVLISVKSMQNAYRNLTNRIEEAFGDSAVLRFYKQPACFGFFFFIVDGPVARGRADSTKPATRLDASGNPKKTKGVDVQLALVEEGGDFFDLSEIEFYLKEATKRKAGRDRKDVIVAAQNTLLDMLVQNPSVEASIHYDAIALIPAKIQRIANTGSEADWDIQQSETDPRLALSRFFSQLVETARLRGFV